MQIEALMNKREALRPLFDLHQDSEESEDEAGPRGHKHTVNDVTRLTREDVQKELEDYVQGIKRRLTMNVNKRVDPILDVFDMLQLQEVHLKTKSINHKKQFKNKRKVEDQQMRRGGNRNRKHKKMAKIIE